MLGTTRPSHRRRPLLNDVYQAHTVREPWQAGDLVLVDNVRTARSREARTGRREVLAGLAAPSARGVLADDRGGWALTPVEPAVQQPTLPAVPPFAGSPEPRSGTCCRKEIVELVGATYRPHGAGESVSPQSYLLRFPAARPRASWRCPPSRGGEPGSTVWSRSPASRTRPGRDAAGLGPADPQRPRHRLPVRRPGVLSSAPPERPRRQRWQPTAQPRHRAPCRRVNRRSSPFVWGPPRRSQLPQGWRRVNHICLVDRPPSQHPHARGKCGHGQCAARQPQYQQYGGEQQEQHDCCALQRLLATGAQKAPLAGPEQRSEPGVCGSQVQLDVPQRVVFISVQHLTSSTPAHESPVEHTDLHLGLPRSASRVPLSLPSPRRRQHRRLPGPVLGRANRGSAVAVARRAGSGVATAVPVPDLRMVNDLVAVGLQPGSHVLRRPGGGSRAVDASGEDVIGHGVGQHGSGVHGIQGAASSAPRPPGLRPYVIPAGRKCDRGCAAAARGAAGTPGQPEHGIPAARNDGWMLAVTTRAAASRSLGQCLAAEGQHGPEWTHDRRLCASRLGEAEGPKHVQHEPEPSHGHEAAGESPGSSPGANAGSESS